MSSVLKRDVEEMATNSETNIAALQQWKESHEDRCKERYQALTQDTAEIKGAIKDLTKAVNSAVERIHSRIDDERKELNRIDGRIDKQRISILTTAISALAAVLLWLAKWLAAALGLLAK